MFVWSWVAGAVASCTVPLQSAAAGSRCKVPLQSAAGQSAVSAWKSCGGAVSGYDWSRSFAIWGLCWHIFLGGEQHFLDVFTCIRPTTILTNSQFSFRCFNSHRLSCSCSSSSRGSLFFGVVQIDPKRLYNQKIAARSSRFRPIGSKCKPPNQK